MARKRNKFRGDLWIMLMMGFLLLWIVLAHELQPKEPGKGSTPSASKASIQHDLNREARKIGE